MLVKILSYTASVLGTARYKAILLSCFALIISFAGVGGVVLWHYDTAKVASKLEQPEVQDETQQGSLQLGNSQKQAIPNGNDPSPQPSQQPSGTPQKNNAPVTPKAPAAEPDVALDGITLSAAKLSIAQGAVSEQVTATNVQDSSNLVWEVVTVEGLGLHADMENTTGPNMRFTVRVAQDIDKTRTYDVTVQVRDTVQNTILTSKTITVTIL